MSRLESIASEGGLGRRGEPPGSGSFPRADAALPSGRYALRPEPSLASGAYPLRPEPPLASGAYALPSGAYSLRPDSGKYPVVDPGADAGARARIASARAGLGHRAARFFRRRARLALVVFAGLAGADAALVLQVRGTARARATVVVEPARSVDSELQGRLPTVGERLNALVAHALPATFVERELVPEAPALAQGSWLRAALDARAPSGAADRVRERILVAVEGGERAPVVRVTVDGAPAVEVAAVASRVAARLVALDEAFRAEDARARREAAARSHVVEGAALARATADLEAFEKAHPGIGLEDDASLRAEASQLAGREAQDESREAELAAALPLLEPEEAQRHAIALEEAEVARRAAHAEPEGTSAAHASASAPTDLESLRARVAALEADRAKERASRNETRPDVADPVPPSDDDPTSATSEATRFLVQAPGFAAWRDARTKLEATRSELRATRARLKSLAAELARKRELLDRLPALELEHHGLQAAREARAAELEKARRRVELAERLAAIELGTSAEGACAERLALADPALEVEPGAIDRAGLFALGLAVAALAALAVAGLREARDRSLHETDDVRALGLPVLGAIPRLRGKR